MNRSLLLCIVAVLALSMAVAGGNRRAEKMAEEKAVAAEALSFSRATTANSLGWASFDIESATSRYKGIEILPGGVVWINGNNDASTGSSFYGYRSVDNGATWRKFTHTLPTGHNGVSPVAAKDSSIALIGTNGGSIYRTTNGGTTWDSVYAYSYTDLGWIDGIEFLGTKRDTVLAFGDADRSGLFVARSTNAGVTWTRLTLPDVDSLRADTYWASTYTYGQGTDAIGKQAWISLYFGSGVDPRTLVTTDAGDSWSVHVNTLTGGNSYNNRFYSINFKDANNGWGVCRGFSSSNIGWLVKTTDGGKTWSDTISVQPGVTHSDATLFTAKPIPGTSIVWAGGYGVAGQKAWWSTDNGVTWTNLGIPTGPTTNAQVYNGAFVSATMGFSIGRQQNLKLTPSTAIADEVGGQPEAYSLSQNYPNPFNPSTTIAYAIPEAATVTLKVYDMLGREVATLVQADQAAGSYSVRFDGSSLSSGVYFYMLKAGSFASTRSLVLVK